MAPGSSHASHVKTRPDGRSELCTATMGQLTTGPHCPTTEGSGPAARAGVGLTTTMLRAVVHPRAAIANQTETRRDLVMMRLPGKRNELWRDARGEPEPTHTVVASGARPHWARPGRSCCEVRGVRR